MTSSPAGSFVDCIGTRPPYGTRRPACASGRTDDGLVARMALAALVALACLPGSLRAAPAVDSLTIEQCVSRARSQAPELRASRLERSAAAFDSLAVSRNARPAWSLDAGATVAPKGFYDPTVTNLGGYESKLGVAWTSHDGGRRARERERGRLGVLAASSRTSQAARDAGLEAADLATQLLRLQHVTAIRSDAVQWLDRLANLVRSGVAAGVRSPSDSIRVSLERDAAVAGLASARLQTTATSFALLDIMGIERDGALAISEHGDAPVSAPAPVDSARILAALDRLPELQLAGLAEAQSRIDIVDAGRQNAAVIEWSLDAGLAGADLTHAVPGDLRALDANSTLSDRLRRDLGGSAAVHVHLPLWDGRVAPSVQAREHALGAAQVRRAAELTAQRRRALVQLEEWRTAAWLAAAAEATAERAERSLLKVKSLYGGGATTLLDLLDAWRTYQDARERVEDARQQSRSSRFRVEDRR